ncbi:MAG: DUF4149 domain-containing protein [Candidatus Acidiferrales bacterium]
MPPSLRFLQFFALGTWVGAILFFSFVVAPGAFRTLQNPDEAGALVGYSLARLHVAGIVLGVIYLVVAALGAKSVRVLGSGASICVIVMLILTAISQYLVIARIEALRIEMGSVRATPPENPMRLAFDRLHGVSVWLEVIILLAGIAALYLTARSVPHDISAPAGIHSRV